MHEAEQQPHGDPDTAMRWESVLLARAQRRLVEHELTRRRTLLLLTVLLAVAGVVLALARDPALGGLFVSGALVPGIAALR